MNRLLRQRMGQGLLRIRRRSWSVGQAAFTGALAWEIGVRVLHHPVPFFAVVAVIVCLGTSYLNRIRRVGELAVGVTVGVWIAELLVHHIGRGAWQIGLVVLLSMLVALLLDGGVLLVNQAALQAVFVTVLPPPEGGLVTRWEDALLGGSLALLVAFALPPSPIPPLRRESRRLVQDMATALRTAAQAARDEDLEAASAALELARATQPTITRWHESVNAGEEISRWSPLRRRNRTEVARHRRAVVPLDHAVRNLRVAIRRVVATVEDARGGAEPLPEQVPQVLDELAAVLLLVPGMLCDKDGRGCSTILDGLTDLSAGLDPRSLRARSLSATVIVGQVRSAVIDLYQLPGLTHPEARRRLPVPPS
jgi:uncharacterized membrane protein YgaE (UPF0421/DUF939 family)